MMLGSFYYKTRAKEALRGNWQTAMLIAFFSGILSTLLQVLQMVLLPDQLSYPSVESYAAALQEVPQQHVVILLVAALAALVFSPMLALGSNHYFVRLNQGEDLGFAGLFSRVHSLGKALWLYVRMFVQIFLWSLLLFIPGIIAAIRYSMAPYFLAENQELTAGEALERSKEAMADKKLNFFILMLSFVGWMMLAMLLQTYLCEVNFVVGTVAGLAAQVWVAAYQNTAVARFYCVNSVKDGVRKAYNDLFDRFEEMGMDQATIDRMRAQTEEEIREAEQERAQDGTFEGEDDSTASSQNDDDILD